MKILMVWPSAEFSTFDVAVGYKNALVKLGHEVIDWKFYNRLKWVCRAFDVEPTADNLPEIMRNTCEMTIVEAVRNQPNWVLIVSALGYHPNGAYLLRQGGFKIATVFSESPYDDEDQEYFTQFSNIVFTNDLYSSHKYNWTYLPPAFDPAIHHRSWGGRSHDVVIVGTGWAERFKTIASVNWDGIDLGIYGLWPQLSHDESLQKLTGGGKLDGDVTDAERLSQYFIGDPIDNDETIKLYTNAKICINDHRISDVAETPNPRVYEVLAVGRGLLLTDYRNGLENILGERWSEFVFTDPSDLERKIRYYLSNEVARKELVAYGHKCVQSETFLERAKILVQEMEQYDSQIKGTAP